MLASERQYKTYPNETYYVASTPNIRQMLLDMDGFFRIYLDLEPAPSEPGSIMTFATGPGTVPRDMAE